MNINVSEDQKTYPEIIQIRPGQISIIRTLIVILITLLTWGLPIFLYLIWQRFRNLLNFFIFSPMNENTAESNCYLVIDSKSYQGQNRSINFRNHLVLPYFEQNKQKQIQDENDNKQYEVLKYLQLHNEKYLVKDNQIEKLHYKPVKQFDKYIKEGLNQQQLKFNKKIYGQPFSLLISFLDSFKKIVYRKKIRYIYLIIAILKVSVDLIENYKKNNFLNSFLSVSNLILVEIILVIIITSALSIYCKQQHNKMYNKIQNQMVYSVKRNGQFIKIKLNELIVGDLVQIEKGQIIYFKGLIIGDNTKQIKMFKKYFDEQEREKSLKNFNNQKDSKLMKPNDKLKVSDDNKLLVSNDYRISISNISNDNRLSRSNDNKLLLSNDNKTRKENQSNILIDTTGSMIQTVKTNGYVIVNENMRTSLDEPILKQPLFDYLNESNDENIIYPGSEIINFGNKSPPSNVKIMTQKELQFSSKISDPKIKFYLIVTDNNSLQKHFNQYKKINFHNNFSTNRSKYDYELIIFSAFIIIITLFVTLFVMYSIKQFENFGYILLGILSLFSSNLILLNLITDIISIWRLRNQGVNVVNPIIQQLGMSKSNIFDLALFYELQFNGFIKRQKCVGQHQPEKFTNVRQELFQIYKKAKEPSLLSFLTYSGIINLPYRSKDKIYEQIFQNYGFKYRKQQQDDQFDPFHITNLYENFIKIDWKQVQRFQISQKLIQTVLIHDLYQSYDKDCYLSAIQGYINKKQHLQNFADIFQQKRTQFLKCISKFFNKGKIVKYIGINTNISQQSQIREKIQSRLSFGGILIFDLWPNQQNIQLLKELSKQQYRLGSKFLSIKNQQSLSGYDVVWKNAEIYHDQSEFVRQKLIIKNKKKQQCLTYFGKSIIDSSPFVLADISVKVKNDSPAPADFIINGTQQILPLYIQGRWNLDTITISIICLILMNFGRIITQILFFYSGLTQSLKFQIIPSKIDDALILYYSSIIIPILLINIYQKYENIRSKYYKNFARLDLLVNFIILGIGVMALYGIQCLDHRFQDDCLDNKISQKLKSHFLLRRQHENQIHSFIEHSAGQFSCQPLLKYVNISLNFLVILIMDTKTQSRTTKYFLLGHLNKFYMFGVWLFSIFYFKVPLTNIFRSIIVILISFISLKLGQWIRSLNGSDLASQIQNNFDTNQDKLILESQN